MWLDLHNFIGIVAGDLVVDVILTGTVNELTEWSTQTCLSQALPRLSLKSAPAASRSDDSPSEIYALAKSLQPSDAIVAITPPQKSIGAEGMLVWLKESMPLKLSSVPVLHGDNGATLKATTVLAMLQWLGIKPSYSRPRVSDDNAFFESLFRTAEYRPEFPTKGFADVMTARSWTTDFVHWYNHAHSHSGIRYVSPAQRHAGEDVVILQRRHALYQRARDANPRRWSRGTPDWTPITVVALNPECDTAVQEITDQRSSRSVA